MLVLTETRLEGLYGYLSDKEIKTARNNAFIAGIIGVSQDVCPVENVVSQFTEDKFWQDDATVEVGVDGEQAEFYIDDYSMSIKVPVTQALNDWMCAYSRGEKVKEGVIYIGRDDTLAGEPLFLGIDYLLSGWNLTDFDNLDGMEGRMTRKHIINGLRCMIHACPLATVISDMFGNYQIGVDAEYVYIQDAFGSDIEILEIEESLMQWVISFDEGDKEMGTFTLIINKREHLVDDEPRYSVGIKPMSKREKDLHASLSRLSELSAEIELFHQKLTDRPHPEYLSLEREY